ncbi:MAG TPA: response regulator [Victivallales bacterium]|nr:response regulator [Victivallales bacterium]HRR06562.1 response regulator [Victivallales bacterium]HRR29400.1 response regulator [Victivallales bacterium]
MKSENLPKGTETILLVDDQDAIWDFMIEALQTLGYTVILAENGLDAVEIYKENPKKIDLVILDMIMPKLGGHSTFYQIKAIDPDAKILLSSGYVSEEEVDDILKQGAKGFIPKPHRISVIAKEIRRVLDEGKEK